MTTAELETLWLSTTADNSADFVRGIRAACSSGEVSNLDLVAFLDRTVDAFMPEAGRIYSSTGGIGAEDKEALFLRGTLLAAEILILCEMRSARRLRDRALLFLEFASASVSSKYPFVQMAVKVIGHDMVSSGFTWTMVEKATSLDVLSYHFCNAARFAKAETPFSFTGKGVVEMREGKVTVSPSEKAETEAFGVFSDCITVRTGRSRDIRLKASDQDEIAELCSFFDKFSQAQDAFLPPRRNDPVPAPGDYVDVQYTGEDDGDGFPVMCVISHEDIRGSLAQEELVHYVWTDMVTDYLRQEDCILGARLETDDRGPYFSIADSYETYARRRADAYLRSGRQFEARAVRLFDKWGRVGWLTASGFGGVSPTMEGVTEGTAMVMEVESVIGRGTYINLRPPKGGVADDYDRFNTGDAEGDEILEHFVTTREEVLKSRGKEKAAMEDTDGRTVVSRLSRIILSRAMDGSSLDAFRCLMVSSFLARTAGETSIVETLHRERTYLSHVIAYAQGTTLGRRLPLEDLGMDRQHLLACLECANDDTLRSKLAGYLVDPDPLCRQVAGLLFAGMVSEEFRDEVRAESDTVRRKVCSLLGVADAFRGSAMLRAGKYGVAERDTIEFKSSYVYRNDNGRPDLDYQGRGQVFEAVCAFLNKDGGTVYVGVNDSGDPIRSEGYGLNADIKWLMDNFKLVNGQRARQLGHAVPEVTSVESLSRFLATEKELYFSESVRELIDINPTEDADAIRISVKPSLFEIAYLYSDSALRTDGVAYVRDGSSTVRMTDHQKRMRLMNAKDISREVGFVVMIKEAIDKHQKLVFRNYASASSARVKDRFVVPVNLFYNDENVYCFDLEAKKYKQFRLHRIESIENLGDVYTLPLQPALKCDVFRWLDEGKGSYHIRLRMKVGARNYLLEEYSCAESLPKEEFYKDGRDHWILDTTLYGLGAVRRFYLGLADQIEILDSEDSEALKREIRSFTKESISAALGNDAK